jgi:hypothetical protein
VSSLDGRFEKRIQHRLCGGGEVRNGCHGNHRRNSEHETEVDYLEVPRMGWSPIVRSHIRGRQFRSREGLRSRKEHHAFCCALQVR